MEPDICVICLEAINLYLVSTNYHCPHIFHKLCINKWIQYKYKNPNCPLCRRQWKSIEKYDYKKVDLNKKEAG